MYIKAGEVRNLSKDVKIIIGGPHPTIPPEDTLRDNLEIVYSSINEKHFGEKSKEKNRL